MGMLKGSKIDKNIAEKKMKEKENQIWFLKWKTMQYFHIEISIKFESALFIVLVIFV